MSSRSRPLVALDTSVWIAWIEQRAAFLESVQPIFDDLLGGRLAVVTSVLGLLEVLTGAHRRGDELLAHRFEQVLTGLDGVALVPVSIEIARQAARLRAVHSLRTPDAIHVSTALAVKAASFITMDRRLARVKEIDVHVLRSAAPSPSRKPLRS